MVANQARQLAVDLITSDFGDLVAKVCKCLLKKGALPLARLAMETELPREQLKKCLLVLIQHNCVQAFQTKKEVGGRVMSTTEYTALLDDIIHRLRFPKFLILIRDQFDEQCECLLGILLSHGRSTFEQLMQRLFENQPEVSGDITDQMRTRFAKLVQARYVERCPASEPQLVLDSEEGTITKKKLKEIVTDEERAVMAAAPLEAERFSFPTYSDNDASTESEIMADQSILVGEKRKRGVMEMDDDSIVLACEKDVLWRANFEEFVCSLRHKACIANVRPRLDIGAAVVLEAILKETRAKEKQNKAEYSAPFSMNSIVQALLGSPHGHLEHVRAALNQLGASCTGATEGSYRISLKKIIEAAQNSEMESIVLKRYGSEGCRIFRLLADKNGMIEQKQIPNLALIETKKAFELLYKLMKDDYLQMELQLLKKNRITELQEKKVDRIRKVKPILEASILRLDDSIMLFHNF
ncbi:DNA-directed RNA polymerase III subunit RPC3 isoform X2 [Amborella trichopoda]|uniref:DNA-directed RNA polymerase III subunit RPC3 isoform X2 n=1 Tax=Amborella trichopoda TaxID=13333 RepID=UPI0009BD02E7|nr:DNA-directed RNA polymerase III subunit RPC3 isoform X2 [Amborella trichopoda]|eukprot:XP_020532131.1 DNA-directed RNA polymerase III subunit RPC3 isoform X2 [Amborella trichopoda]